MKSVNQNIYLFVSLCFLMVTSGYATSPSPSYSWTKNNIELSVEGAITHPTYNEAQDHILIRNATRNAGYRVITTIILTLPLDSTRQINALAKSNATFNSNLNQWILLNTNFPSFQFTSDTSAIAKASVNSMELAQFVDMYVKQEMEMNEKMKNEELKKKMKEEKMEAKAEKMADAEGKSKTEEKKTTQPSKKPKRYLDVWTSMTIVPDTTIPVTVLTSQAESGVTKLAKDELQRQLDETEIVHELTYKEWMSTQTTNNGPVQAAVARNLKIAKPQWNKEKTIIKVNIKLDLDEIRKAIAKVEKEIKDEKKPTLSQDTTAKPAGKDKE